MTYFDDYPEFYGDHGVANTKPRLQARYDAIIDWSADIIRGSTILDIAALDGRWSFAALKAGATNAYMIEGRTYVIKQGIKIFEKYGFTEQQYRFSCEDAHTFEITQNYDVTMILGFLYHTRDQLAVLKQAAKANSKCIIIDTMVHPSNEPVAKYWLEPVAYGENAIGEKSRDMVSFPSPGLLHKLLDYIGYSKIEWYPWLNNGRDDWTDIQDYREKRRVTLRAFK